MKITICKWPNNADSPVMFMVDDLANVWIDLNNNGKVDLGEDWGYAMDSPNSSFRFLTEYVLRDFPEVKTTFFVPVNRVPIIKDHKYNAHFAPINENDEIADFFRTIHSNAKYEIAYHGLTHGVAGEKIEDFIQEWISFKSLEEALAQIEKGKKIYYEVFGEYPKGGKYPGYEKNAFSDESIDRSGFLWWCREWNRGQIGVPDEERFSIKRFGTNNVIDIPSTIYGGLFNLMGESFYSKTIKRFLLFRKGRKQIDDLLKRGQVISIQEHIAPARTDGRRQTPNIFDDKKSLIHIFSYLKNKNVWYATGTEIAEYYGVYDKASIDNVEDNSFFVDYRGSNIKNPQLSLIISNVVDRFKIVLPNGSIYGNNIKRLSNNSYLINKLPLIGGRYELLKAGS